MDTLYARFSTFLDSLDVFEPSPQVAAGVSGGPDSLALAFLLKKWVQAKGGNLLALIVDHGLRPESHTEAQAVKDILEKYNISSIILPWEGKKPSQRIQEEARKARYTLLESACWKKGVFHLFMAHHKEDQAETFLSRLGKKSGLAGLRGMQAIEERWFGQIIRPLLASSKRDLISFLDSEGIPFFNDPSNKKEQFERVRLRKNWEVLESLNLTSDVLTGVMGKLQQANNSIEESVSEAILESAQVSCFGWVEVSLPFFLKYPVEIQYRLLENIFRTIGGREFSLRSDPLKRFLEILKTQQHTPQTLSHCIIRCRGNSLFIAREERSLPAITLNQINKVLWGDLYYIEKKEGAKKDTLKEIRPLGKKGATFLQKEGLFLFKGPSYLTYGFPSLWKEDNLLSVPYLDFQKEKWEEEGLSFPICAPYIPLTGKIFSNI